MKSNKLSYLLVLALALTFAATGCKKKPTPLTPLPDQRTGQPGGSGMTDLEGGKIKTGEGVGSEPGGGPLPDDLSDLSKFNQNREALAIHTIHFDFDSSVVKASDKPNLEAVAAYMQANPNAALLIEGNCDERGTEEYNRSLGERRALAAREVLVQLGVSPSRSTTRSFGKDKPANPGHNEAAWAQNRRDDFVVLTPK